MARFIHDHHSDSPPMLLDIVERLDREGVRYVLVGGMAMVLHGTNHVTVVTDLAIAVTPENISAIVRAFAELEPKPTHLPAGTPFVFDERTIRGANVSLRTLAGDVDLLLVTPGVDGFEELFSRRHEIEVADKTLAVACVEDLIKMKTAAGRPKDQAHIAELEAYVRNRTQ